MLFNSLQFLVFFPVVTVIYFLLPHRYRWLWLLITSYYFYMSWKPEYAVLLLGATLISYGAARAMARTKNESRRKLFLFLSLAVNLGMLAAFKYFNFFSQAALEFLKAFSLQFSVPTLRFLLPVGISFYTFQVVGYTIDVFRKKIAPEKHLGLFAVYVAFWPQILAGPIGRAGQLLPQFSQAVKFEYDRIVSGLTLMLWGFFKKVVIADGLAIFVNQVYGNVVGYSGPSFWVATFLFSLQIFADFSGYTDIARGAARVLGINLLENFRAPYLAKSIADFWRSWHISLSSWFQDYVFTPLYLKLAKFKSLSAWSVKARHWLVFVLAMLVGQSLLGLWHGANWTFVAFGLYHGVFIILYYATRQWWDKLPGAVSVFGTFIIVSAGWIFFKAGNLAEAWYIITHLFTVSSYGLWDDIRGVFLHSEYEFAVLLIPLAMMGAVHILEKKPGDFMPWLSARTVWTRRLLYYAVIMMILLFGSFGSKEFIYFNF